MIRHPLLVALAVAGSLAALAPAEAAGSFSVSRPPSVLSTDQQLASYDASGGTRAPGFFSFLAHPNRPAAGFGGFQSRSISPAYLPRVVDYTGGQPAGTIVINTRTRYLYLVLGNGKAKRYGVGVGRPGFQWAGVHTITRKAEWPAWTPPPEMIAREKKNGRIIPDYVKGGPSNPLGARALYLGSTEYRIHGSNEPWTIGTAVSSGCIRMRNQDVIDLYVRVGDGTRVVVM
jgi:lipoprotein-anchoring transpeptidase ErfK/SrfK